MKKEIIYKKTECGEASVAIHTREIPESASSYSLFTPRSAQSRGMTYVETLVWIAVYTSAMIALVDTILYFYRTSGYAIDQASAVASAQHGIDQMVRTIREASYASNGAYPIVSISPGQIQFYANITPNDPLIQEVRYFVQGTTLIQGVIEPSGDPPAYTNPETLNTIAPYVRNLAIATTTFSYFDKNGVLISDYTKIGAVRFISANVVVDINPNANPTQLTLRSSTALRNLVGH